MEVLQNWITQKYKSKYFYQINLEKAQICWDLEREITLVLRYKKEHYFVHILLIWTNYAILLSQDDAILMLNYNLKHNSDRFATKK